MPGGFDTRRYDLPPPPGGFDTRPYGSPPPPAPTIFPMALALPFRRLASPDRYLGWVIGALAAFGVVVVFSAVSYLAETKAGGDELRLLGLHVVRLALAFGLMLGVSRLDYRKIARVARPALIGLWVLLAVTPLVGVVSGGAARWLRVGAFGFQPSELARVALLVYLAVLLARKQPIIGDGRRAAVPLFVWILGTCGLIGMQNLSAALVLLVTSLVVCFIGRVRVLHLASLVPVGAVLALLMLLFSPARAARVESFLGVKLFAATTEQQVFDRQDEGYQAHQAAIAFARGGIVGQGPGKSVQRDFLPAPFNDFIFAIIGEEYGLVGTFAVLGLFAALLFRGYLRVARHAPDPLGLFLATGVTTALALYGFIHAGVASGLLPVTGLPLPFVSYGGSSLVASGLMAGLLLSVSRHCGGDSAPAEATR